MTNLFVFVPSARLFPERAEQVTSGSRASAGHTTRGAARRSRAARQPLGTGDGRTEHNTQFTIEYPIRTHLCYGFYYMYSYIFLEVTTGQVTNDRRNWLKPENFNNSLLLHSNKLYLLLTLLATLHTY